MATTIVDSVRERIECYLRALEHLPPHCRLMELLNGCWRGADEMSAEEWQCYDQKPEPMPQRDAMESRVDIRSVVNAADGTYTWVRVRKYQRCLGDDRYVVQRSQSKSAHMYQYDEAEDSATYTVVKYDQECPGLGGSLERILDSVQTERIQLCFGPHIIQDEML